MKNYVIAFLVVIILVLVSFIYKIETSPRNRFPVLDETGDSNVEVPMFLYVFVSKKNCRDCMEMIEVLNTLPPHFIVIGLVPPDELNDEKELRGITGASFPLLDAAKYKKYIPWYAPSIVGVSPKGDILFTLPGVPGEKAYLENFLDSIYGRLYPVFVNQKN